MWVRVCVWATTMNKWEKRMCKRKCAITNEPCQSNGNSLWVAFIFFLWVKCHFAKVKTDFTIVSIWPNFIDERRSLNAFWCNLNIDGNALFRSFFPFSFQIRRLFFTVEKILLEKCVCVFRQNRISIRPTLNLNGTNFKKPFSF